MTMNTSVPWLTIVLLLPLAGAALLQVIPRGLTSVIKGITVVTTLAIAIVVGGLVVGLDRAPVVPGPLGLRYAEAHSWIADIGAAYRLGLDGLSAWLLALNAGLFVVAALVLSRRGTPRLTFFCGLLLFTESATAGVLMSTDLLLFYLFWEAMLIPLYFMLANYGAEGRGRAALKFVLYTVASSLLMLIAIIFLWHQGGGNSFDLQTLLSTSRNASMPLKLFGISTLSPAQLAFLAFLIAFAVKVPLVPFHTWQPGLYQVVPAPVLVFFAGIVSKLGAYGLLRYAITLFPGPMHDFQWLVVVLALASIIYGALMALSETDVKRVVAYASISHLGFICLGIATLTANGINGAVIQMINHGVIIATLFLILGAIEARTHARVLSQLSGLEKRMPVLYVFFVVATLAGLGMPGTNGFVGEFAIMLGAFQFSPVTAVIAGGGVILACWYMLRLHQGLMHGPLAPVAERVSDIRWGEALILAPLTAAIIGIGVFPRPITDVARSSVERHVSISAGAIDQSTASGTDGR